MPRKRAPGGGRKAAGPFTNKLATLSTRITPELRQRLDQETAKRQQASGAQPWSLSQEIETRLRESLDLPAELQRQWGSPHIKALAQLISRAIRTIEQAAGANPFAETADEFAWNRNPFVHEAVTIAINESLARLKPAGPIEAPPQIKDRWKDQATPRAVGLGCVLPLLDYLPYASTPPYRPGERHGELMHVLPQIKKDLGDK